MPSEPSDAVTTPANSPKLLTVSPAEAGQKLVQYLGRVLGKDLPGSVLMRWIRTGQVRVDGEIWGARASVPIEPGSSIVVRTVDELVFEVDPAP